jgi:threonyl-tRNA synthetase
MRRLGSQEQRAMPLEEAARALVVEATPPDLRRAGGVAFQVEPERHLTLDGHHVHPETVA